MIATRLLVLLSLVSAAPCAFAQTPLTPADTALIGRILLAEDRRDSMDAALARGAAHADQRISRMARRAMHRIRDTTFAARDSFPLPPSPTWPEPAWKERFRALRPTRDTCSALRRGAMDPVWQVRLQAAAVARVSCSADDSLVTAFRSWVDALPADASRRHAGTVSWHGAAYGIVALARLRPADAKARMVRVTTHRQWQVRMYAARAAAAMSDTGVLRALATDQEPNVQEVAIEGLSRLIGHAGDEIYASILGDDDLASVRAAAIALKGTTLASAKTAALAAFERWAKNNNASERDVRVALLEAAGKTAADDRPPPLRHRLPPRIIPLALGADIRLRVTMSQPEGGASFVVKLRGDVAPMMGARILELANAGAYDGQSWHRVADDFVVQGGWPGANEYTGHEAFFREELGLSNRRGTIGMSTRGHDTGDAQWFFNLRDNLWLDPNFTVWAEVVEGIEVMDGIMEGDRIATIREIGAPSGFGGTWGRSDAEQRSVAAVGDAAFRVGDMGSGWGTPLTIIQRPDSVIVEWVFFAPYDLQPPVRLALAANGAESMNDIILSHTTTRLRSKLSQKSDTLVISTLYPSPTGKPFEVRHTLTLESPSTLVVDVTRGNASSALASSTRTRYARR